MSENGYRIVSKPDWLTDDILERKLEGLIVERDFTMTNSGRRDKDAPKASCTARFDFSETSLAAGMVYHAAKDLVVNVQNAERKRIDEAVDGDVDQFIATADGEVFERKVGVSTGAPGMSAKQREVFKAAESVGMTEEELLELIHQKKQNK